MTINGGFAPTSSSSSPASDPTESDSVPPPRGGRDPRVDDPANPAPIRIVAVELSDGVPPVPDDGGPSARRYGSAQVLVRVHDQLVGVLDVDLPSGGLTAAAHTAVIMERFGDLINKHLAGDGREPFDPWTDHPADIGSDCPARRQQTDSDPFVSVVVPTIGRTPRLRPALESLAALDYPRFEIIIVDNAPTVGTTARLIAESEVLRSRVRYTSELQPGVTYARNHGLAVANGTIVAFADDDVIVDRQWLRNLVAGFSGEHVVAVTGQVLAGELETPAQVWIEEYGGFAKGSLPRTFDKDGYDVVEDGRLRRVPASPRSIYPYLPGSYGTGANMAFRTNALRELGGFDHRLSTGGEDIDVLMRVVLAGHTLVYEPAAIVWHAHRPDLTSLRRTMYTYGIGLSAVMFKCLATDRRGRRALVRRLPSGIAHAIKPQSGKNNKKRTGYPAMLTILEICGMVLGPAYFTAAAWSKRSGRSGRSGRKST